MKLDIAILDVIGLPNDFSVIRTWEIMQGGPTTLYFQLIKDDNLGKRRYIPQTGSTCVATFMRARQSILGQADTQQTFSVTATPDINDKSIFKLDLTSAQVDLIISGTVQIVLTEGTSVKYVMKHYAVQKKRNVSGC